MVESKVREFIVFPVIPEIFAVKSVTLPFAPSQGLAVVHLANLPLTLPKYTTLLIESKVKASVGQDEEILELKSVPVSVKTLYLANPWLVEPTYIEVFNESKAILQRSSLPPVFKEILLLRSYAVSAVG
ncbi:hypothetical protein HY250_03760 [Candidatus Azambacteria bacterium]|nr:hypothetical protein [Candidatus Azambacteria bacterium]